MNLILFFLVFVILCPLLVVSMLDNPRKPRVNIFYLTLCVYCLAACLSTARAVGIKYTHEEVIVETSCAALFDELDRLFSDMIFIHNASDPRFEQDADALFNLIPEDFVYTINGNVITGRDAIVSAVSGIFFARYQFRQTLPPIPRIYPSGFYDPDQHLARLHSVVIHSFVNATGSYQDFNNHFYYCQKQHHDGYLMINATLTTYKIIAT